MLSKALTDHANARAADHQQRLHDMIVKALNAGNDMFKAKREAERLCIGCYYIHRYSIVGQAFTAWACESCGTDGMHHNTGTPRLCNKCADEYGLCIDCGADRALRFRRQIKKLPKRLQRKDSR